MQTVNSINVLLPLLSILTIISSSSILHLASADSPLKTRCYVSEGNFLPFEPYTQALNSLAKEFMTTLQPGSGSTIVTINKNKPTPFVLFGLALCHGNVPAITCSNCVSTALNNLRKTCGKIREAITWYNKCMVRYATRYYVGSVEAEPGFFLPGKKVAVSNITAFDNAVVGLLEGVSLNASFNPTGRFAMGEKGVVVDGKKEVIYSFADCARDITGGDCQICLGDLVGNYSASYLHGNLGGRGLAPSCTFRYEIYPFYQVEVVD